MLVKNGYVVNVLWKMINKILLVHYASKLEIIFYNTSNLKKIKICKILGNVIIALIEIVTHF